MTNFPNLKSLKDKLKIGGGKKETLILLVGAVLLALILYFYLLFRPTVAKLMDIFPKVSQKSTELKKALRDIENRSAIEADKTLLESKINYYEKKLPTEKEIPKLLEGLSDIADESDVKIIGIKPAGSSEGEGPERNIYQAQPIEIEAKCGYHQLGRFLQRLEIGDRIMKVSGIEITADPSNVTTHNVKLSVITYTLTKEK